MLNRWRIVLHSICLAPLLWLASVLFSGDESALGADPIKELIHFLGDTAIVIFCLMYLLGIVLQRLRLPEYQILRRTLGLWACAYALLHMVAFLGLELAWEIPLFLQEVVRRPYLVVGAFALALLMLLAISSLPSLKRRLGKGWFSLQQWGYVALVAGGVHYYWSLKSLSIQPLLVFALIGTIVVLRLKR